MVFFARSPVVECCLNKNSKFYGKYYIWDVQTIMFNLHKNGQWRNGTFNGETKEWSGFFDSEEEAISTLKNWMYDESKKEVHRKIGLGFCIVDYSDYL